MRILVYSDGSPLSDRALHFAARLTEKLGADLAVITIRSGTHAIEPPPPFGTEVDLTDRRHLPEGLQVLAHSVEVLCAQNLLDPKASRSVLVRELSSGHMFVCRSIIEKRIPFYVSFGHMIEVLNHETDKHGYDLLIIAPPSRGKLRKVVLGDTTRKLVLDLHTSVLIVRGGRMESPFVVCVDGSPAAKRQWGIFEGLLPAIAGPLKVMWVRTPDCDTNGAEAAEDYLDRVTKWLTAAGRTFDIVRAQGQQPAALIADTAGDDAVIVIGASLRHDIYRRLMGSMPMQILSRTLSSVLVVKGLPEGDPEVVSENMLK